MGANACCPCDSGPSQQCCRTRYNQPPGMPQGDCGCIPYVIITLPNGDDCGDFECTGYFSGNWGGLACTGPENTATYRWIRTGPAGGTFTVPATLSQPPFGGPVECLYLLQEFVEWTNGCTGVSESIGVRGIILRMSPSGGGFSGDPPGIRFQLSATAPIAISQHRCVINPPPGHHVLESCGDRPSAASCFSCDTIIEMPPNQQARCYEPFTLVNQSPAPFCGVCIGGAWIPATGVGFRYPDRRGSHGSIATVTLGPPQ